MISTAAFFIILAALILQIVYLIKNEDTSDPFSHYLLLLASTLLFITIIIRSVAIHFVAITNTFESLVFFTAMITLVLFLYRIRAKGNTIPFIIFGGTLIAVLLLAVASSPLAPKAVKPPVPALQSYWLVLHVLFAFIGESFFVVGFIASIIYLLIKDEQKKERLDHLTLVAIAIGYPVYAVGALLFGAIWAEYSWGAYWSWDPKEVWALITFLTYTFYLHARLIKEYRGIISAYISIAGFLFIIFTYFGVNFIMSGLHSYAG